MPEKISIFEVQENLKKKGKKGRKKSRLKRRYAAGIRVGHNFDSVNLTDRALRLHRANRESGKSVFGKIAKYLPSWMY